MVLDISSDRNKKEKRKRKMNATGKQMIAFWLHKKGEQWSLKSVDKDSNPEVNSNKNATFSRSPQYF